MSPPKKNIGIIVARFQTSYLHDGHRKLIRYVKEKNNGVVILLGTTQSRLTKNNPLDFESRRKMILELYPEIKVYPFADHKTNDTWNKALDLFIKDNFPKDKVTLYGSRGSFLGVYKGKYKTEMFESDVPHISATRIRNAQHGFIESEALWRQGVIWASGNKYPISYQAVDIAVVKPEKNQVLLGKKSGENKYRFIGGFVDPSDDSLELAAKREVTEECGDIETDNYKYIGSFRIDDWRYRNEDDKIMTVFFMCQYIFGHVKPQDDISELKWFDIDTIGKHIMEDEHHILMGEFLKFVNKTKTIKA